MIKRVIEARRKKTKARKQAREDDARRVARFQKFIKKTNRSGCDHDLKRLKTKKDLVVGCTRCGTAYNLTVKI